MSRLRALTAAAALATLAFAACGGGDNGASKNASNEVTIELVAFQPETLTVDRDTTVTWQQKDPGSHTVTSGTVEQGAAGVTPHPDGRLDSGEIATNRSFEFTFAETATYPYFCRLHPATMRGVIDVR